MNEPASPCRAPKRPRAQLAMIIAAALAFMGHGAAALTAPAVDPPALPAAAVGPAGDKAASCTGTDLLAALPADKRAAIDAAVARTPFARGTRWTAVKGDARIDIVGTYHFDDPRHASVVDAVRPLIAQADALLVEAGPDEERQLTRALADDPTLMVDPAGPTLPERLSADEWQKLSAALHDRGIPAIMASRMRPWYVAMLLGVSPCMLHQMKAAGTTSGLDHQLISVAKESGTPVRALEPWATVFGLFEGMTPEEELDMIRAALPAARRADDYAFTTIEAYFRGDVWAIWEFNRQDAYESSGLDRSEVDRQVALAEQRLMTGRNTRWIGPLTAAASDAATRDKHIVAAFGALHLPGDQGVLRLLEKDGWTVSQGGTDGQR